MSTKQNAIFNVWFGFAFAWIAICSGHDPGFWFMAAITGATLLDMFRSEVYRG